MESCVGEVLAMTAARFHFRALLSRTKGKGVSVIARPTQGMLSDTGISFLE